MAFKYESAVPWGRSFDEYQRMFHLTGKDLRRRILGCADGPASFDAESKGESAQAGMPVLLELRGWLVVTASNWPIEEWCASEPCTAGGGCATQTNHSRGRLCHTN